MDNAVYIELSTEIFSLSTVEDLDEANRESGWNLEYRQLESSRFSALFSEAYNDIRGQELEAELAWDVVDLTTGRQASVTCDDSSVFSADVNRIDRAREFIEANLQAPIAIADICANPDIKIRSLQRLFLRDLNLTPIQYILARRLNSARRQLIDLTMLA